MTKAEFVESLANTLNQTKSESERVLEAVVDVLKQALQRGEKIDLRGLGVFKVRETKPRQARNPRTGEAVSIPAKKAAVFKPGKELSALLNTSAEEPGAQAKAVEHPVYLCWPTLWEPRRGLPQAARADLLRIRFHTFESARRAASDPLFRLTNPPWYESGSQRNNRLSRASEWFASV